MIRSRTTSGEHDEAEAYTYDGLDRLVASVGSEDVSRYEFDAVGNQVRAEHSDDPSTAWVGDAVALTSTFDAANQLVDQTAWSSKSSTMTSFSYDGNGNLVEEFAQRFNKRGRPQGRALTTDYVYDEADRLVGEFAKRDVTVWERDGLGRALGRVDGWDRDELVYDGLWLIGSDDDVFVRTDQHTLLSQTIDRDGSEQLLGDVLGTIHMVTDADGDPGEFMAFSDYGAPVGGWWGRDSVFGFTGEYQPDVNVEFYARTYMPELARFAQQDLWRGTLGNPATQHRYQYGLNNPTSYRDVLGYWPDFVGAIGDAAGAVGGAIVDVGSAAVDFVEENKESIVTGLVVGAAVGCVLATAGGCIAGVGLGASSLTTTIAAGAVSSAAAGVVSRAVDDDPNTNPWDIGSIAMDTVVGGTFSVAGAAIAPAVRPLATRVTAPIANVVRSTTSRATGALSNLTRSPRDAITNAINRARTAITEADFWQRVNGRHPISERLFSSRWFGVESPIIGNTIARNGVPSLLNRAGSWLKFGWSKHFESQSWRLRLGIGVDPENPNVARLHPSVPGVRVPWSSADRIIDAIQLRKRPV